MARQRQSLGSARTEKPYDATATIGGGSSKYRSHRSNVKRVGADTINRHKIILPSPNLSPTSSAEVNDHSASGGLYHPLHLAAAGPETISQSNFPPRQHQHYHLGASTGPPHHHHLPPSSFSYTDPHGTGLRRHTSTPVASASGGRLLTVGGGTHIDNTNSEQGTGDHHHHHHHGHGQAAIPRSAVAVFPSSAFGHHGGHTNTTSMAATVGGVTGSQPQHYQPGNENESSNFDSLNLDDDYRKSSFGKQSKLSRPSSNRGLWSLFGGGSGSGMEHASPATTGYSSSRNNPNVFFNASNSSSSPTSAPMPSAVTTSSPMASTSTTNTTTTTTGSTTMRYYNLDNNTNGANRRSMMMQPNHRLPTGSSVAGEQQQQQQHQESQLPPDSLDDALVSVQRYGDFDADNELDDSQAPITGTVAGGDKFLRGSTVSQSFIKNVRIMRKKSSSYDVNTPNGGTGTNGYMAAHGRGSQRGKEQVGGASTTTTTTATTNSFKQRGSQMMAAAAKHFTKRNRAPAVPNAITTTTTTSQLGSVADNDGLTGTVRPTTTPAEDGIDEPGGGGEAVSPGAEGSSTTRAGSTKRRLFQPRTMDRAEI
ncbi:mucin-19-like [Anopheles darlingi]|uniref:mucin-19-like n=1 Tax=Anopheles darlingi TaxID=43151 RepID=UPI0020FFFECA|nr:mucin-19-like [Anopheles darlingi]